MYKKNEENMSLIGKKVISLFISGTLHAAAGKGIFLQDFF